MNAGKFNPLIDSINTLCNLFVLNVVFLITCIPVFTIGTALSSLYYVMIKEIKGEYGYLVRTYIREFKRNFKNSTIAFLIFFFIGAILLFNALFWPFRGTALSSVATGILAALSIIWLVISHYTFPLIGRFVNTTINAIKNSLGLAISNFKCTLALLLIDVCAVCFCLFFPLKTVIMVLFTFGFVLVAYFQSIVFNKVFTPYEKQE